MSPCVQRACVRAASLYQYINIHNRMSVVNVNVSVNANAALPSVGSVVSRDMTHAITGRRGALYQLLAIATTRGRPRREIQRVPPRVHTAPNNINNKTLSTRLLVSLMPASNRFLATARSVATSYYCYYEFSRSSIYFSQLERSLSKDTGP